jgi:hypothetical protein
MARGMCWGSAIAAGWSLGAKGEWRLHQHPDGTERVVAAGLSLEYAHGVAMDVMRGLGVSTALTDPAAVWWRQPASEKQLRALERWRVRTRPDVTICDTCATLGLTVITGIVDQRYEVSADDLAAAGFLLVDAGGGR